MIDFINVKNKIDKYLILFSNEESVNEWLKRKNLIVTKDSANEIIKKANDDMIEKSKLVLNDLLDYYDDALVENVRVYTDHGINEPLKDNIIGGGVLGLIGGAIFLGPVGWAIGAFVGAMGGIAHNNKKHKLAVVSKILENQQLILQDVKSKCITILDKLIFDQNTAANLFMSNDDILSSALETVNVNNLTYEQLKIKMFLETRGIKVLVHVTDSRNIKSILKYGLLPVAELNRYGINYVYNDPNRFERYGRDSICLSIEKPNKKLIYKFKKNGTMKNEISIYIDASILWREINIARKYYQTNAATKSGKSGSTLSDFMSLFDENITYIKSDGTYHPHHRNLFYDSSLPTDIQAEIQFFGRIDPKYIIYLYTHNSEIIKINKK